MREQQQEIQELQKEVERLRDVVGDIHGLTVELLDGAVHPDDHEATTKHIRRELTRLRDLVFKDELTGVLNRRGFYERFTRLFSEAVYHKEHSETKRSVEIADFAVLFIDLDDFKQINDSYGHDTGDEILQQIATICTNIIRDLDGIARFGGEEFVIVLPGATEAQAYHKAENLRQSITQDITLATDPTHRVTASIGVTSLAASDADDLDELVAYADQAMYEAKTKRGKNAVVRYSELHT